jgi:hypothetical protein
MSVCLCVCGKGMSVLCVGAACGRVCVCVCVCVAVFPPFSVYLYVPTMPCMRNTVVKVCTKFASVKRVAVCTSLNKEEQHVSRVRLEKGCSTRLGYRDLPRSRLTSTLNSSCDYFFLHLPVRFQRCHKQSSSRGRPHQQPFNGSVHPFNSMCATHHHFARYSRLLCTQTLTCETRLTTSKNLAGQLY